MGYPTTPVPLSIIAPSSCRSPMISLRPLRLGRLHVTRRHAAGLGATIATAAVYWVYTLASASPVFGDSILEDAIPFSPADAAGVQYVWPMVGTAAGLGAVLARVFDTPSVPPLRFVDPVAACVVMVVILVFSILRRLGTGWLPATAGALGLVCTGLFWSVTVSRHPEVYAALLVLGTVRSLIWWVDTRRWSALALTGLLYAAAVAIDLPALALLPVLVLGTAESVGRPGLRMASAVGVGGALGAIAYFATIVVIWRAADPSILRTLGDAEAAAIFQAWTRVLWPSGAANLLSSAGGLLVSELGVVGAGLCVAGVIKLAGENAARLVLWAACGAATVAWTAVWGTPGLGSFLSLLALAWVAAGVGMSWLLERAPDRRGRVIAGGVIAITPILIVGTHYDSGAEARALTSVVDRYFDRLQAVLPRDAVLVVESPWLDRASAGRSRSHAAEWFERAPQDVDLIAALVDDGRPVIAFPGARRNLQALGVMFAPLGANVRMSLPQYWTTIPDGSLVAVATAPPFPSHVLPGERPFVPIGGAADLFGKTRFFYAVLGVKGRAEAIERLDRAGVDLTAGAGDAVGGLRSPVTVRVLSDTSGGVIEINGRPVARTKTGLAMAVVTPTGALDRAVATEHTARFGVPYDSPLLSAARVVGRELCVPVTTTGETDVSTAVARAGVGAVLRDGDALTLYVGGAHPLRPRQTVISRRTAPDLHVRDFDTRSPAGKAGLRAALETDGFAASSLANYPYAYRISAASPSGGESQLNLTLGGFGSVGYARAAGSTSSARAIPLCAAVVGAAGPLFSNTAVAPASGEIDLQDGALTVFGWHHAENTGPVTFRWTAAPQAELLVPLARVGPIDVEITVQPASSVDNSLRLRVNDRRLAPQSLAAGVQTLRWSVPADAWHLGMNQIRLETSTLVRPADLGLGRDARLLGVAVSRIRFVLQPLAK